LEKRTIDSLNPDFNLAENLHSTLDDLLESYLPDREFVQATFDKVFFAFTSPHNEILEIKHKFTNTIYHILNQSIEKKEIPALPMMGSMIDMAWYFKLSMTQYWLKDKSEGFHHTTELLDLSTSFGHAFLESNLIGKAWDIVGFILRTHIQEKLFSMDKFKDLFSQFSGMAKPFSPPKS